MLNKKIRKLVKNPKLFFSDMNLKRSRQINALKPKKIIGENKFTVVSAVYNVDKYLEQYFDSLVNQRLDFKNNIQLVLVDDGSPDNSAQIIKDWQKKYPNNITYVKKENGGQASARNYGLQFVKTEWVTFIDPDDFVDLDYFLSAENFIKKNSEIGLLSCNFIFYFEDLDQFKDTHPLKFRFNKGDRLVNVGDLKKDVQLSVNSAIFRSKIIFDNNVLFGEDIKPNFEDAHFVSMYLLYLSKERVAFLKSAQYFYRKRSDGTSTLDRAWEKPTLYNVVLEKGCLDLLRKYKKEKGFIPESIQITNLYHLIWYFKKLINNSHKLNFLSDFEKDEFLHLVNEIFSFIDTKTIMEFSLADCWFFHKVGLLGAFKKQDPASQIVYIDSYDRIKGITQLRFFSYDKPDIRIKSGNTFILPYYEKEICHEFVNETFVREFRLWVKVNPKDKLNVTINKKPVALTCGGKQHKEGLTGQNIVNYFKSQVPNYVIENEHSDAWVFMDRDFQADDNAEHLYRYVMHNHPERNIYFALNRDSHDWPRLELEGFRLLAFGSERHLEILRSCSKVISSNADHCVVNLLGPKMLTGRHFVFLQHGVIHNDLSTWLNQKENIDCFVTSSPLEYESIAGNGTKYKYSEKEVVLTGLPRHDYLVKNNNKPENVILVMPTWRADIVGKSDLGGHSRSINDAFLETEFARCWLSLLNSNKFSTLLDKYNYKIVIYPHPNLIPYVEYFRVSDDIEVLTPNDTRIQDVFCRSAMLLTDYTSVAFDMAVQNKPTLYYQFDEYEVLHSGRHTFSPGYFKHRRDGFGPICNTEEEVLFSLEEILQKGCALDLDVANRIDKTFPLRDGTCCERTFDAIVALDSPKLPDISADRLIQQAQQMTYEKNWAAAEFWWKSLSQRDDVWLTNEWYSELLEINCLQVLKNHADINGNVPENIKATVLFHVFLYVKKFLDKSDILLWMDTHQKDAFLHLLDAIFSYIDDKTILKFSREGSWFLHKIGMLNVFKNKEPDCQYVYVDSYDRIKGLVQLRYFIRGGETEVFQVSDKYSLPVYEKKIRHDILDRDFIFEKRVWLPIKPNDRLIVNIEEIPTILSFGGKQYKDGVTGNNIITYFKTLVPNYKTNNDDNDSWIFMDQKSQADDNAEYLYRYVMQEHPGKNIYFALDQDSQDWPRLEKEGFRLLPFGSSKHIEVLQSCDKVISSQVENYVVNLLGSKMLYGRHFVYLQSGVICNDISSLLNAKDNIDCIITSTPQEYQRVTDNNSKYKYSSKEVVLTGLPRFDFLLDSEYDTENTLLIIPSMYEISAGVYNANNLKHWNELLSSEHFISMLDTYGYKAQIYVRDGSYEFDALTCHSDYVEIITSRDIGYRDILRTSRLLLTDYSSATFDMAIQNKYTVYYHANDDECLISPIERAGLGYFNYHSDGFGPVCNNISELISQISLLFDNGCSPNDKINNIITDTFIYKDGKCCERVFNAIIDLDCGSVPDVSVDSMIFELLKITDSSDWKKAAKWWTTISLDRRCWETVSFYTELLEHSCLHLLKHAGSRDLHISLEFQNSILRHLFHYFKRFIDHPLEIDFLTRAEVDKCWALIKSIVQHIDDAVIMKFSQPGYWFLHKVGLLGAMKESSLPSQIIYIESIDRVKNLVQLRYFSYDREPLFVQVGNKCSYALYSKEVYHYFFGSYFVAEKREWHKLPFDELISVELTNVLTTINLGGKQFKGNISGNTIYTYFDSLIPEYSVKNDCEDIWIFMDSEMREDNNAECLYRYVKEHISDKRIFFALNQESSDWARLENEGFNLLAFGCNKHKELLKMCSKVISSQSESYVTNLLGPKMLLGKHFVYLQNGVNQSKSAAELNKKEAIDCFITSTLSEYHNIIDNNSSYKYSSKEVVLTGMPRFDALSAEDHDEENMILIMPGALEQHSSWTELEDKWEGVFVNPLFNNLIDQHGYKVMFYSHSDLCFGNEVIDKFKNVEFLNQKNSGVMELIRKTKVLLTDSTDFSIDMKIQNKPVIYINNSYESLGEEVDYVYNTSDDAVELLSKLLLETSFDKKEYSSIKNGNLDVRDGGCCERVFSAICDLDSPHGNATISLTDKIRHASWYEQKEEWGKVEKIWHDIVDEDNSLEFRIKYIDLLLKSGNICELASISERLSKQEIMLCSDTQKLTVSFMYFVLGEYDKVIEFFEHIKEHSVPYYYEISQWISRGKPSVDFESNDVALGEFYMYIKTLIDNKEYDIALSTVQNHRVDLSLCNSLTLDILYASKRYDELYGMLSTYKAYDLNSSIAKKYFVTLLNKKLYHEIVIHDDSLFMLNEKINSNIIEDLSDDIKEIFAVSYFYLSEWLSAIYKFESINKQKTSSLYEYAFSYRMVGDLDKTLNIIQSVDKRDVSKECWLLWIELSQILGDWDKLTYGWKNIIQYYPESLPDDTWLNFKNAQMMLNISKGYLNDSEKAKLLFTLGNVETLSENQKALLLMSMN